MGCAGDRACGAACKDRAGQRGQGWRKQERLTAHMPILPIISQPGNRVWRCVSSPAGPALPDEFHSTGATRPWRTSTR
jgi:hypothetical protein